MAQHLEAACADKDLETDPVALAERSADNAGCAALAAYQGALDRAKAVAAPSAGSESRPGRTPGSASRARGTPAASGATPRAYSAGRSATASVPTIGGGRGVPGRKRSGGSVDVAAVVRKRTGPPAAAASVASVSQSSSLRTPPPLLLWGFLGA